MRDVPFCNVISSVASYFMKTVI